MTKKYTSLEHQIRNIVTGQSHLNEAAPVAVALASQAGSAGLRSMLAPLVAQAGSAGLRSMLAPLAGAGIAGGIALALKPDAAGENSDYSVLQKDLDMTTPEGQAEYTRRINAVQKAATQAQNAPVVTTTAPELKTRTTATAPVRTPSTSDSMPRVTTPDIPAIQIGDKDVDVAPEIKTAPSPAPAASVPAAGPATPPVVAPVPATGTTAGTSATTKTATKTATAAATKGRGKRFLPFSLGADTPSPATDSVAASPSDLSKYMHMAKPYVSRQQVKEDATEERSKIENVARPNSRRDRAVKQQEIQKKIIEEKKSLAQVVKKNIEDTKKEKNNSPVIINPTLNKPETGGY